MIPYVLPFVLYLVLTAIAGQFIEYYAWVYPAIVVIVGGTTATLLYNRDILRPHARVLPALGVGLLGIALWIGLCELELDRHLWALLPSWLAPSARTAFDPYTAISNESARWAFIAMRLVGLVLVVPVVEEIFWRGFLARWLLSPDWQNQPVGRFTPMSFALVTVMFTLAHPEWLAAAVYGALLNLLLMWKRDLWSCVVAHGTSNLVLGIYVLKTGHWLLW